MGNKISIPLYEGMELKMTVEKGFLIAEYSEEEDAIVGDVEYIGGQPIGSIFEHKGKSYLVSESNDACTGCSLSENCEVGIAKKCNSFYREDKKDVIYKEIKEGDICVASNNYRSRMIFIYRSGGIGRYTNHYATNDLSYFNCLVSTKPIRMATEEEKQILLDTIHKDGKTWDEINKKIVDYIEHVKVGDICIVWNDEDYIHAEQRELIDIFPDSDTPYKTMFAFWENAIKCESLEQYQQFVKSE